MRTLFAVAAAAWFTVAAFQNGPTPAEGGADVAFDALHAIAQTLFAGLAIVSLALVDWSEVIRFVNVPVNPTATDDRDGRTE